MTQTRECGGCGGTGQVHHDGTAYNLCWACDSTGKVEDRIGLEDAKADAITLEAAAETEPRIKDLLWKARYGRWNLVKSWVKASAHAAFVAVPGLRGE
jgi:hypothetical protein